MKNYLIMGVANKKSIAYSVARDLTQEGHRLILSVQNAQIEEKVRELFPNAHIIICDVENSEEIEALPGKIQSLGIDSLQGFLHSLAYAQFDEKTSIFHHVPWDYFQRAMKISCYSLVSCTKALESLFDPRASVVTVGISDLKATVYGYLGPIKATLEAMIPYLAKSFSSFSRVRFNIVCAGPLKTSASSGIPNYIENYLFSQKLMLREDALSTQEVSNTISFLLSEKSSGINGEKIVVDVGMGANGFDEQIVQASIS